jgi:hypothetical protein
MGDIMDNLVDNMLNFYDEIRVKKTLKYIKSNGKLEGVLIDSRLNHPYFCSIKTNWEKEFNNYSNKLDKYIL